MFLVCVILASGVLHGRSSGRQIPDTRQDAMHDIYMSQLNGECLPGDRDQPDQIFFAPLNESLPSCVPQGYVGVKLILGEFAQNYWKSLVLHDKSDSDNYRHLVQMEGKQSPPTAFFALQELQTFDLCLWKEVDEVVGTERKNLYRLVDAEEEFQEGGDIFTFTWFRDDQCVQPDVVIDEEISM